MKTLDYLTDPATAALFWPGVATGLALALVCALLSPLVVLKRMSFVGQGISHAAFGGIGIAALLATAGAGSVLATVASSAAGQFGIVLAFCALAALVIAALTDRPGAHQRGGAGSGGADTAIGIVLVASMTLGAILVQLAFRRGSPQFRGWESVLFGDILSVTWTDAAIAWGVAAGTAALVWFVRRPLLFWAFDEAAAPAFGVPTRAMKLLLVLVLALVIVTAMKLAGVVLATALLVLPGAAALRLSDRLTSVGVISGLVALAGCLAGLVVSFETDLPPGACIVATLTVLFAVAWMRGITPARAGAAAGGSGGTA